MENVLKKIINKKKERIKIYKKEHPEGKILENIKNINNFVDFKSKIFKLLFSIFKLLIFSQ